MSGGFFEFREKMAREATPAPATRRPPATRRAPAGRKGTEDRPILSVTQLTAQIERTVKDNFPASLLVRGEVSNYKHNAASGHAYFTLKDPTCCVDCVMWRSDAAKLKFLPQDGMELLATARLGIYGQRGRYQLYVSRMEPLGQGALEIAFAQLKARLEEEGLFAPHRKRPIPRYPLRIALVTSRSTAALADMLKVLRRFPFLRLWVYHVPVQGEGAAEQIAAGLTHLGQAHQAIGGIDAILLARGGGSLEDLWAFNEEPIARAIAACGVPVITGIGHEVDVSIADLVADHHAHTPTEAAAGVTAGWRTAEDAVGMLKVRCRQALRNLVQERRQWVNGMVRHELFRRPTDRVNVLRQGIDDHQRELESALREQVRQRRERLGEWRLRLERNRPSILVARQGEQLGAIRQRLRSAIDLRLRHASEQLVHQSTLLRDCHPRHDIELSAVRLGSGQRRLGAAIAMNLDRAGARIDALSRHLQAVGPEQVLRRGYSITSLKRGNMLLRSAAEVRPGDRLVTRFADGTVESIAEDPNQPGLFD